MFTNQGIALDTYVQIDGSCTLSCEVIGDEAQFEFGHRTGALSLITNEDSLTKLANVATEALHRLRATQEDEEVSFTVVADNADGVALTG